ncbi:rhodanese-like domain-containing protein [Chloroflexota bacterium]
MKCKYISSLVLLMTLVTSTVLAGGCAQKTEVTPQAVQDVTAQEAFNLIQEKQNNPDFIIVDVRTPQEFADGHIEDAVNIDFNSDNFKSDISKLDRNKEYLIYCRSGSRSRGALEVMKELNFTKIYHLYEGIVGWTGNSYPTVK